MDTGNDMNETLDKKFKSIEQTIATENTTQMLKIFLVWALFASVNCLFVYHYFTTKESSSLTTWFICYSLSILTGLILTLIVFKPNQFSRQITALWNQGLCIFTSLLLATGVYVINYIIPVENPEINLVKVLLLSGVLLSITYIFSIIYLTQKFQYFIYIFIPSSCVLLSKIFLEKDISPAYYIILEICLLVVFISAILIKKQHDKIKNATGQKQQLRNQIKQHILNEKQLFNSLNLLAEKSQKIENELQLNNQLLEQKVKSRTFDVEQMNIRLENHQQNLAFAHEAADINSWVWNIDKRTVEFFGPNQENMIYQRTYQNNEIYNQIHPDDLKTYGKLIRAHLRGHTQRFEMSYRIYKNNQWLWFHDIGKVIARNPKNNKPLRMVGIRRNIQQEKSDQEKLRLAANVFNQVDEGVFVLDHNLCFVEVNHYFEKLIGLDECQIIGKHLFDITINHHEEIRSLHTMMYQQLIQTGEFDAEATEEFISGKKLTIWTHINAITDENNKVIHYVGILTDLTERKKQEKQLSYLQNYDTLTDLPNRLYFNNQLHQYLSKNIPSYKQLAVIRINIDRFRFFNEYLSNHAGDELLKQVAQRLRHFSPQALLISHLNNDDFAIIYNTNQKNQTIQQYCQMILQKISQPYFFNDQEHFITVSIGVALYPEHGRQIDSLNVHAEQAIAEAKQLGGNTIRIYSTKQPVLLDSNINLDRDLRQAIKNNQFEVYYQPKIGVLSKSIVGFEALIRWNHPVHGMISPDAFLPYAEESSLISEIGYFVLNETCKQIKSWQNQNIYDISVSVNVVAQQIHRGRLLADLKEALELYGISGQHLELEITESSLIDHSQNVEKLLSQIKELGILVALDDFGTGYSSFAYLTRYPIDILKIDKTFVNKIGDSRDEAIVTAMIAMGKSMGMRVIAEGVETIQQVNFLKNQGCDELQGYFFSKPLNAKESTDYLNEHKLLTV